MNQFCNGRRSILITRLAMLGMLIIFSGCANRSPIDFAGSDFLNSPASSVVSADLPGRRSQVAEPTWFHSYENAHRESLQTGKPILAAFTGSDWCGPCIQLKKKVFDTPEFQQWATDNVVLLELDFPKRTPQDPQTLAQNKRLARKYNIAGYPTVLFLNTDGGVMGKQGHGTDPVRWVAAADLKLR